MPTGCCCARRPYVQGATNSGQPASPSPATSLSAIWPAYQVNGTGTHFWLKEDELTPLLSTGDITLSGKTFNRPDTGHQWFDQFVLSNHGKAVLDVGIVNGETQIKLNGKVVSSGKVRSLPQQFPLSSSKLSSSVCTGVRFHCLHHPAGCWRLVGASQLNAAGVDVEIGNDDIKAKAGALAVTIRSSLATKFASGIDQAQDVHLNINFDSGIPSNAKGIFAELAGVQEMSEATTALLKQPKGVVLYETAAKQNQCPAGCVPVASPPPPSPPPPSAPPLDLSTELTTGKCPVPLDEETCKQAAYYRSGTQQMQYTPANQHFPTGWFQGAVPSQ